MRSDRRLGTAIVLAGYVLLDGACSRSGHPGGAGVLEKDALALIERYDEAWMRQDVPVVEHLLAPGYVYFSSKGRTSDAKATKAMLASPGYRLERGQRDELRAHQYGSTVVVDSRWRGAGSFDGKPFTDDQRCSVVVGFADGAGRVLSEHCTAITPD